MGLTQDQARWARERMARWIQVRLEHEGRGRVIDQMSYQDWQRLIADIQHSTLLQRLLEGKDPLPEPPPLRYGYPDYISVEEGP